MNSFSLTLVCFCLFTISRPAYSQQVTPIDSPELELERAPGKVTVRFPTIQGMKYQVFRSGDLKEWEPVGNAIEGNDAVVTLDQTLSQAENAFFRLEARAIAVPVSLEISASPAHGWSVRFPSLLGQTYLAFASVDSSNWFTFSDLIHGTGDTITLTSPTLVSHAFFAIESMDITPLPNMVRIQAGRFRMGSPVDEKDRDLDEDPLTEVIFPTSFWMGKYEVTQSEYEQVMGTNPSWFKGDRRRPVEQVSWHEALLFCAILTERERAAGRLSSSFAYRLPTEAEFEYACRAGTSTRFSHGDDLNYEELDQYAWYDTNSGSASHPVGAKKPNLFGLFDMHGNVWEWCLDWYSSRYAGGTVTSPVGPRSGFARVFRGGGWDYLASTCRSAYRNNVAPTRRLNYVGLRIVLAPNLPVLGI